MDDSEYDFYLNYYIEQSGGGLEHYRGHRYIPAGQEGGGLGDLFKAALPAIKGFAKKAGKRVLSAGARVLKDAIAGKNIGASAKDAFMDAGGHMLDDGLGMVGLSGPPEDSYDTAPSPRKRAKKTQKKRKPAKKKKNIFG